MRSSAGSRRRPPQVACGSPPSDERFSPPQYITQQILHVAEALLVILPAAANNLVRLGDAVDVRDLALGPQRSRCVLVGQEVVLQAIEQRTRTFADVVPGPIGRVALQDGDDLVVGLVA